MYVANLSKYQDEWTRYHDKPCVDSQPSSNNGWIYTAYAFELGLYSSRKELWRCIEECAMGDFPRWNRTPGKMLPPLSRDEIIGLVHLELLFPGQLKRNHWQFCNLIGFEAKPLYKVNWFKALAALWRVHKAGHRNALWKEPDLWNLGFRLPPQDTWYVLRKHHERVGLVHTLYFYISSLMTVYGKNNSGKLILWLKLRDLGMTDSFLYKQLEWKKAFIEYFPGGHIFMASLR